MINELDTLTPGGIRGVSHGRSTVSGIELLDYMAADPDLLRRPIIVMDGLVLVGFEGLTLDGAATAGDPSTGRI